MELTPQRGAIAIQLDRPRMLFYDMKATWLLIEKYGESFIPELYTLSGERELKLKSMDALAYFLWAGLQADAESRGEAFDQKQAEEFLRPATYTRIFRAVILALTWDLATPERPGKTDAAVDAAKSAVAKPAGRRHPGPTKASVPMRRNASPTRR